MDDEDELITTWDEWLSLKALTSHEVANNRVATSDYCSHGVELLHPALLRMRDGEAPTDVEIESQWNDDHVDCFIVSITFASTKYVMALLWMDPSILLHFGKAVNNSEASKQLVERLLPK